MMKLKSTDFDSSVPPDTSEMKISGDEEIESFPESPKITPTDRS
jgi:hypothetical protein